MLVWVVLLQRLQEKPVNGVQPSIPSADAGKFVEELLDRASALLLSEISEDSIKQHGGQLGAEVAKNIKKCLREDLKNLAITFKNTDIRKGFMQVPIINPRAFKLVCDGFTPSDHFLYQK
ncbi:hypothetical protein DITRI_Ditri03aG0152800 [Diplodiscus trichospermus]